LSYSYQQSIAENTSRVISVAAI